MMRALEQGEAAVHRASESLRQQEEMNRRAGERVWQTVGGGIQAAQQSYEKRKAADYEREFREKKTASELALDKQKIELEAKKSGFEYGTGTEKLPFNKWVESRGEPGREAPGAITDRERPAPQAGAPQAAGPAAGEQFGQLAAGEQGPPVDPEMLAQRKADLARQMTQMSKPIEGPQEKQKGTFVLSERGRRMREMKEAELEVKRQHAKTQQQYAEINLKRAKWKQDKEAQKVERETLQKPLNDAVGALNELMTGKHPSKNTAAWLARETIGHPVYKRLQEWATSDDPLLLDETAKRELIAHIKNQMDEAALAYSENAEEIHPKADMTSRRMGDFLSNIQWVDGMLKSLGAGAYSGVRSQEEKNAFCTSLGASLTRRQLLRPPTPAPTGPEQAPTVQATNPQTGQPMGVRGLTSAEQANARGIGLRPEHLPQPEYQPAAGQEPAGRKPRDWYSGRGGAGAATVGAGGAG
jgi:hypothetical protein